MNTGYQLPIGARRQSGVQAGRVHTLGGAILPLGC